MVLKSTTRLVILGLAFVMFMNGLGVFLCSYTVTFLHRLVTTHQRTNASRDIYLTSSELSQLSWIGARDFIYKGHVYDLESYQVKGDIIQLSCTADHEETQLAQGISKQLDLNTKSTNSTTQKMAFLPIIGLVADDVESFDFSWHNILSISWPQFSAGRVASAQTYIAIPPPEIAC